MESRIVFSDLPIPNQAIIRDYLVDGIPFGIESSTAALASYLIEESNSLPAENKNQVTENQINLIQKTLRELDQAPEQALTLLKKVKQSLDIASIAKPNPALNLQAELQTELKVTDLTILLKDCIEENNFESKLNLTTSERHSLFALCQYSSVDNQAELLNEMLEKKLDHCVIDFIQSGTNGFNHETLEKLVNKVTREFHLPLLTALLNNLNFVKAFNEYALRDLEYKLIILCKKLLEMDDKENEQPRIKPEYRLAEIILKNFTLKGVCVEDELIVQFYEALGGNHYVKINIMLERCLGKRTLEFAIGWAITRLNSQFYSQIIKRVKAENLAVWSADLEFGIMKFSDLNYLLRRIDGEGIAFLKIVLQFLPKPQWSWLHKVIQYKIDPKHNPITSDLFYENLENHAYNKDKYAFKLMMKLDIEGFFITQYTLSWRFAELLSKSCGLFVIEMCSEIAAIESPSSFLYERPVDDEKISHPINPSTLFPHINHQNFCDLIEILPTLFANKEAVECVVFNSKGYPAREKKLLEQLDKCDSAGNTLLHHVSDYSLLFVAVIASLLKTLTSEQVSHLLNKPNKQNETPLSLLIKKKLSDHLEYLCAEHEFLRYSEKPDLIGFMYTMRGRRSMSMMQMMLQRFATARAHFFRFFIHKSCTEKEVWGLYQKLKPSIVTLISFDYYLFRGDAEHLTRAINLLLKLAKQLPVVDAADQIDFVKSAQFSLQVNDSEVVFGSGNFQKYLKASFLFETQQPEAVFAAIGYYVELEGIPGGENLINFCWGQVEHFIKHHSFAYLRDPIDYKKMWEFSEWAREFGFRTEQSAYRFLQLYHKVDPQDFAAFMEVLIQHHQIKLIKVMIDAGYHLPAENPEFCAQFWKLVFHYNRTDVLKSMLMRSDGSFKNIFLADFEHHHLPSHLIYRCISGLIRTKKFKVVLLFLENLLQGSSLRRMTHPEMGQVCHFAFEKQDNAALAICARTMNLDDQWMKKFLKWAHSHSREILDVLYDQPRQSMNLMEFLKNTIKEQQIALAASMMPHVIGWFARTYTNSLAIQEVLAIDEVFAERKSDDLSEKMDFMKAAVISLSDVFRREFAKNSLFQREKEYLAQRTIDPFVAQVKNIQQKNPTLQWEAFQALLSSRSIPTDLLRLIESMHSYQSMLLVGAFQMTGDSEPRSSKP